MSEERPGKGADPTGQSEATEPQDRRDETVLARPRGRAPRAVDTTLEPGATIGGFSVIGMLGSGGMAVVYSAYDRRLDRKVALKLLRTDSPEKASGDAPTRLLREAQAMAKINHPNVITVHEVGTYDAGVYVAMEFAEGGTLGAWLERQPRTQREMLDVFVQAGRGLAAAHAAGLIHRDFKPDNVLMTRDGTARVTDFGLVTRLDEEPREVTSPTTPLSLELTRTGAVMGTPPYMAPEQFTGGTVTARTDQFSFCVALYRALYRQPPFFGSTFAELFESVTEGKLTVPASSAEVPGWLRQIVLRGLARDPARRFPSMDALLAELTSDRLRRRRRYLAWGGGAAAIATVVGVLVSTRAAQVPSFAVRSTRNLTDDPGCEGDPSFTPDGREVVFDGVVDNDVEIEAIAVDGGARRRLTHSPGLDIGPAVSPDGRRVAYKHFTDHGPELRVVGIEGDAAAPPQTIAAMHGVPTWTSRGHLLYCDAEGPIMRAGLDRSPPAMVARLPADHTAVSIDEFPDGELVLAMRTRDQTTSVLVVAHARPGGVAEPYVPRWEAIDSGHLRVDAAGRGVYYTAPAGSGVVKLHWRARGGGEPIVVEATLPMPGSFSVSPRSRQLVMSTCDTKLYVGRIRSGAFAALGGVKEDWRISSLATLPGDELIVTAIRPGESEPHLWRLTSGGGKQVVVTPAKEPAVSPDGQLVAWSAFGSTPAGIYVRAMAGGAIRRLTDQDNDENPAFSHDGARVLFTRAGRVYSVPVAGNSPALGVSPPGVVAFAAAPDHDLIAVIFEERGRHVVRTGRPGGRFQDLPRLADRSYDEVVFRGSTLLLGAGTALYAVDADGTERELWSSPTDSLTQVAVSRTGDDLWALVTTYEGDLVLLDGSFP